MKKHQPTWKRLLHELETGSELTSVEASKALSNCRSRNCMDALVSLMIASLNPRVSELAAYTLRWTQNGHFIPVFVECVRNKHLHEGTRGQAAEALGSLLRFSRPSSPAWKHAEPALLDGLSDASPTLRFWCCYALGEMRSRHAISTLEQLRDHDSAVAPGWWYVREEAADALQSIAGELSEDRIPVHQR